MTRALALLDFDPASGAARAFHLVDPDAPHLRVSDLAATRGDGVFETIRVRAGRAVEAEAHLDRLAASAARLDLPVVDPAVWRAAIAAVVDALAGAGVDAGALTLVVSRGVERGPVPTAWVAGSAAPDATQLRAEGVRVALLDRGYRHDVGVTAPWLLVGAKTLSTAVHRAAVREAQRRGADDAVFVSSDGYVLEGASSSLLMLCDGILVTPPLDGGVLAGTTQAALFRAAASLGVTARFALVTPEELLRADAVWLVSSVRGVVPVREIDGTAVRMRPELTAQMNALLEAGEDD